MLIMCVATLFFACQKYEVTIPNFDVKIEKLNYNVGDTVSFKLFGDANYVLFYSGDVYNNYEYRNEATQEGEYTLSFDSQISGNASAKVELLASTDFTGIYTADEVKAANWYNLTDKALWATSNTSVNSGKVSLNDLYVPGKPIYIAFRSFKSVNNLNTLFTHSLNNITVQNTYEDRSYEVKPGTYFQGWKTVDFAKGNIVWKHNASNNISIANTIALSQEEHDNWIVSGALQLNRSVGDYAKTIKYPASLMPDYYSYVYTKAGVYNACFVVSNRFSDRNKEVLKSFQITIK